ncbi:hypothetical protein Daus18300_000308 [Diaporthe australafricana]|uniref:Uncharacterized protein n=1 Tax=Diaporthe australafricana TaxID=127596 RepID=A0ABR3Y5N7_9PEZI
MGIYYSTLSAKGAYLKSYHEGVRWREDQKCQPPTTDFARSILSCSLGLLHKAGPSEAEWTLVKRQLELMQNAGLDKAGMDKEGKCVSKLDQKLHQMESLVKDLHTAQEDAANYRLFLADNYRFVEVRQVVMEGRGKSAAAQVWALEKDKQQLADIDDAVKRHQEAIKSGLSKCSQLASESANETEI